ncbi:unnamed protein product [Enterobius vermicularis]|uniref:acid phosphatase n=1 Tax=Enterobius vermicularis TaxID=51028 RepID=A0A0N4VJ09_ENTVE|nr:unnamed protein product [Enterobius vermicularis]
MQKDGAILDNTYEFRKNGKHQPDNCGISDTSLASVTGIRLHQSSTVCVTSSLIGVLIALLCVNIIWRHGDRAPEKVFDALKVANESFPNGLGNLTALGRLQAQFVGEKLRRRYFDDNITTSKQVAIRSTKLYRTIETAKIIANEFNVPNVSVTANIDLKYDTEGNPFYQCYRAQQLIEGFKNNYLMKNEYKDFYNFLHEKINYDGYVHPILDQIVCMKYHDLHTPEWTSNNTVMDTMKYLSWIGLCARVGIEPCKDERLNKLSGGAILNGLIKKLKTAVDCDRYKQNNTNPDCDIYFSGLSAHDITLAALFSTFPNYKKILGNVPYIKYVAHAAFEAFYANSFRDELKEITQYLPGCEHYTTLCPLDNFVRATKGMSYDDVQKECTIGIQKNRSKRAAYFAGNLADYMLE